MKPSPPISAARHPPAPAWAQVPTPFAATAVRHRRSSKICLGTAGARARCNTRYQPASAARLGIDQVRNLKLKWAFGFDGDLTSFSQPAVLDGQVFVGSSAGIVYALRAWHRLHPVDLPGGRPHSHGAHGDPSRLTPRRSLRRSRGFVLRGRGGDRQASLEEESRRSPGGPRHRLPRDSSGGRVHPCFKLGGKLRHPAWLSLLHLPRQRCRPAHRRWQPGLEVVHHRRNARAQRRQCRRLPSLRSLRRQHLVRSHHRCQTQRPVCRHRQQLFRASDQAERLNRRHGPRHRPRRVVPSAHAQRHLPSAAARHVPRIAAPTSTSARQRCCLPPAIAIC